jgi:hypothetical protein
MNGGDVLGSAAQGFQQGLTQGAMTGGIMAGANMAANATPGVGNVMRKLNQAGEDWKNSGSNFNERLTNTLTSGDSAVGEWLQGNRQSGALKRLGMVGLSIKPVNEYTSVDPLGNRHVYSRSDLQKLINEFDNYQPPKVLSGNSFDEASEVLGDAGDKLLGIYNTMYGGEIGNSPVYNKQEWAKFKDWIDNQRSNVDLSGEQSVNGNKIMPKNVATEANTLNDNRGYNLEGLPPDVTRRMEIAIANGATPTEVANAKYSYQSASKPALYGEYNGYEDNIKDYNSIMSKYGADLELMDNKDWTDTQRNAYEKYNEWANNRLGSLPEYENMDSASFERMYNNDPTLKRVVDNFVDNLAMDRIEVSPGDVLKYKDTWDYIRDNYDLQNLGTNNSNLGNRVQDGSDTYRTVDVLGNRKEYTPDQVRQLINEYENYKAPEVLSGNSTDEVTDAMGEAGVTLSEIFRNRNGGQFNPYSRADGEAFNKWVQQTKASLGDGDNPTTLGGWLKQAGKRIAEDIDDRGIGLSTRLLDENGNRVNMAGEAQADNNPQTAVYRALTKDKGINKNNAAETLKTSRSEKLRGQAAQELLKQFGTIDKPTAKATNSVKTMQEIANAGFTKPGDIERIADNITGSNGEVNKLVQALVANSKPVNTYDGYDGKSIDEFIDDSIARHALDGINEGKAVKSQIKALFNSLESRRNGSVSMTDMPEDVMDVVRGLEAEAANYEGRSGMNYGTTTPDKLNAAKVLKDVATLLKDRTFETADMERVMTPEVAEGLKSLAPGNKQWAKYVDEKIMTAKTPQDLRSVQAPFVNIKKIIDNGYMNSMTYGGRVGNVANGVPTNRRTIINNAANAIFNSNIANRAKARVLSGAANRIEGTRADQPIRSLPTTTETQTQGEGSTPTTRIYDIIGRQEGLNNGEQARSAEYLAQAAQEAEVVPMGNNYATMGQQAPTTANTSVYNAVMGGGNTQGSGTGNGNSYFPATGDYWTDIIGRAMSAAIDADDVDAFGALYSMYQSQIANLQKQSASANQPQKITSTQQRANAAMSSLNRLSQMKPDLGYDLSGIPIIGGIATFGGNDYESEAKSLAQQIGYMVSGANIKEEEAFNIGKAYVPQPFDSEHARQTKLQRAYDIIRQYQNGYAVDDGSLV